METMTLDDVKADIDRLVERAAAGEQIVIERSGQPIAVLGPPVHGFQGARRTALRPLGLLEGQVWIGADFDDPLPADMQRAFDGDAP